MTTRRLIVPLLAVLAFTLTACFSGNPLGPKVGVIGDSITYLSDSNIKSDFTTNYAYDIRAFPGARISDMLSQFQQVIAEGPDDLVINLGTNDVHLYPQYGYTWLASLNYEA